MYVTIRAASGAGLELNETRHSVESLQPLGVGREGRVYRKMKRKIVPTVPEGGNANSPSELINYHVNMIECIRITIE